MSEVETVKPTTKPTAKPTAKPTTKPTAKPRAKSTLRPRRMARPIKPKNMVIRVRQDEEPVVNRLVIFKVQVGDDIRKIEFVFNENGADNYQRFLIRLRSIYGPRLRSDEKLLIKYKDEDNDMITVADNQDFCLALKTTSSLKFVISERPDFSEDLKICFSSLSFNK